MSLKPSLVACVALLSSSACSPEFEPSPPVSATSRPSQPTLTQSNAVTPESVPDTDSASGVQIEDYVLKTCRIGDEDAYFAFDSARVDAYDRRVLALVATCFETGPLAGKGIRLIGHTDPRGTADSNWALGLRRAQTVRRYLVNAGMDRAKLETTTRGAEDAHGTDQGGWAKDRRVDLLAVP